MGVGWGLWVEVEVLGDERTSTPAVVMDLGRCFTLPAAALCRLIVVIGVMCSSVWGAMSVARTPDALMLDIESCDRCAGCPGYGVIAQGHGRVVVEVIDAAGEGSRCGSGGTIRRWICREHACQTVTFLEHDERMCAHRARLGARAIRWAIRQLRFEGATIAGLARQLATTWNTVWSHIKPCLQAASDDPARFAGVRVLGVDEHVWHHQDRRRRGPRELTGIVDLTRGKDHPTARLSGPGPRKVWHRA